VSGPLSGVRVLELAHVMAGPVCGLMLADMGADVVKVERLPGGDASRAFLPPDVDGESAAFMMMNRGKRGIAVDLTLTDGDGVDLEMGTPFDDFTDKAHHGNTAISAEAQRNRMTLLGIMTAAGWDRYDYEWWHYQLFDVARYPRLGDDVLDIGLM